MTMDRELLSFRQGYYEMLVALFRSEPTGELMQRLAKGIRERTQAARNLHPLLGAGWEEVDRFLTDRPPERLVEEIIDEYTRLFLGPHGPEINPYESFYLTGRLLDRPLANIRTFLKTIGVEKEAGYAEPEDCLAFELEVMRWLAGKQKEIADPQEETRFLRLQSDFLREHLLVWGPVCAQDIERATSAKFYRAVAKILQGFLDLELNLFRQYGLDNVATLDLVRQRYGAVPTWKGPTFDPTGGEGDTPASDKKE